ncbi:uncharacterized protein LOC110097326 isoform X1 [Dendrobium catenatum]|uniref:uncharacterized protein LOC110097326 isoform X1 n=1 Tax=Dendrobium catenatum TaxID=906689 RepID=UPI0009F28E09|nr:uncharacterized protein LOC110097326 isoform X1 [Dendrobium catenatum]
MMHVGDKLCSRSRYCLIGSAFVAICLYSPFTASVTVPLSNCYALDNSSRLVDFTDWIGHVLTHEGQDGDLVVRFCKDVEFRSQMGYIDFGRFGISNYFVAGSGSIDFIQGFYNGDLMNCEHTFDKLGRTAQVNIICGSCLSGGCKGEFGCICNISYDASKCRVIVEIAIPCAKRESRVFEGFTVGFHPRSWEIVYNGLTQIGFEKPHPEFSFGTGQSQVPLYLTAISSVASLVGKPSYKVSPKEGLEIRLSGSAASGVAPTTLSPSVLLVNWRCERIHDSPYKIYISIPVDGYDPIEFTLTKFCGYTQGREGDSLRGWATLGVISCVLIVLSVVSCCGGFIYKTRIEHQHGLYALPGMTILSACLDAVSGPGAHRLRDDSNGNSVTQASWERVSTTAEGTRRTNERRYGSI